MRWDVLLTLMIAVAVAVGLGRALGMEFRWGVLYKYTDRVPGLERLLRGRVGTLLRAMVRLSPAIGVLGIGLATYLLVRGVAVSGPGGGEFVPLLPGVTIPLVSGAVSLALILVVHELGHAVALRLAGIRIRRVGFFLVLIFPGAFVEPDQREFERAGLRRRIEVLSAGPAFNVLTYLACLGAVSGLSLVPKVMGDGVIVHGRLFKDVPLEPGERILSVDGHRVHSVQDLRRVVSGHRPGDRVIVRTDRGVKRVTLRGWHGRTVMGVYVIPDFGGYWPSELALRLMAFLELLGLLSLGVGVANLLPIKPLDGGRILEEVLREVLDRKAASRIVTTVSLTALALLILNIRIPHSALGS